MKLGPIVLKLRMANTRFGSNVAGCANLGRTLENSILSKDQAFVVQTIETATENLSESYVDQIVTEVFSVITVLANDTTNLDKTGLTAFDSLHAVREEVWAQLIGWDMREFDPAIVSPISYVGGNIYSIDRAYLVYQFDFTVKTRLTEVAPDTSKFDEFLRLYTQFILAPNDELPITDELPIEHTRVDMADEINQIEE